MSLAGRPVVPRTAAPVCALLLARSLAWAGLVGGWLVLGGLARHHLPGGWTAFAPQAVWLFVIAVLVRASRERADTAGGAAAVVAVAGATTALAVALAGPGGAGAAAVLAAAVAWGVWLVAASRGVRRLRQAVRGATGRAPAGPAPAAAVGATLAWLVAGDPVPLAGATLSVAAAIGVAASAQALLAAWAAAGGDGGRPRAGCHAALFDCALAWPGATAWRRPADWPRLAASLAMLPMMASLPWMAEGCAAMGWSPSTVVGMHLAAMLAPPLLCTALAPVARWASPLTVALLAAGGVVAVVHPGVAGLTAAMLLQAAAWGFGAAFTGWPAPSTAAGNPDGVPAHRRLPVLRLLAPAAVTLGLGAALGSVGPSAWWPLQVALGALGVAGVVAARRTLPGARAGRAGPVRAR